MPTPKKIFLFLLLFLVNLALFVKIQTDDYEDVYHRFVTNRSFGGDEVYFLRMVQSLATDGDIELSNLPYLSGIREDQLLKIEFMFIGKSGGLYCLHPPGLSFLLLPSYKLDSIFFPNEPDMDFPYLPGLPHKLYFTRLLLMIVAISILFLLFRLLQNFFGSFVLSIFLLFLLALNSPFFAYTFQVVPEISATFFCLLAMNAIFCPFKNKWLNNFLIVLGIGFLPWFHQRFIFLALGLFLAFLVYRYKEKDYFKKVLVLVLLLSIAASLYLFHFYSVTGNPSPLSTSKFFGGANFNLKSIPLAFFGNFFHPVAGNIWHYPWVVLFFFGIYWAFKKDTKLMTALLLIFIPYYLAACSAGVWSGGTWPRNRYIIVLYTIFLIFSGFSIQDLLKKFSYSKIIFYFLYFGTIFLNMKLWFLKFQFSESPGNRPISHAELFWIIISISLIIFMYFTLFLAEKYFFSRRNIELWSKF